MRPAFLALLLVANAIFDVGITVGSFGFYRDGWEFSFSDIITTLVVTNYSFLSSPLEFLLLAIFRQLTILFSVFLVKLGKSDKLRHKMMVYGSLGSLAHIVSVVKTAYLSEHLPSETSPGLLMNFWSTFLMTIIHLIVIFVVFKKQNAMYGRLDDQEAAENANPDPINETDNISTKEQLLSMWDLVKSNRKCFYFGFVFLIFLIAADLAYPATHGKVVATALAGDSVNVEFWLYVYGFLMFSQRAATEIMGYFKESAQAHTHNHVRQKLFGYIILQDMAFFDRNPSGELTSRISNDCKSISTGLSNHVWTFTQELATLILALPVMLFYSWKLTIVSTAALPLVLLSSNLYGPFQERLSEELTNNAAAENGTVTEGLSSIRTVRVLATEEFWISRYTNNTVAWLTTKLTSIRWAKIYKTVTSFMHRIEYLIMFGYATHLFGNNTMDIPTFLAFIFYQYQVEGALLELSELFPEVMETLGLSRKVMLLFKQQPLVPLNQGSATPEIVGNVVFENITFAYPTNPNKTVINGINFTIPEKKMTAFVGPSGGGKSTIVSLLNRCYPPSNGRILIDETPIQDFDHVFFHNTVAIVTQEPQLFSGTIRENIVCGQVGVTEEDLREAARQAHALEFIVKLENGFDTECGERGTRLSGGEKQRIAIARALIRKPKVLILDEATSALDPVSEQKVKMALKECSVGRTVICIAHRLTSVRHADMIAFVSDGRIVEKGTHEELMGNADGEYHKLVMDHVNSML